MSGCFLCLREANSLAYTERYRCLIDVRLDGSGTQSIVISQKPVYLFKTSVRVMQGPIYFLKKNSFEQK